METMETVVHDLRFAVRMFAKQPGFYAVAVLTLALGIGVNSAIFSFAKVALLDPLPYRDPGRLVMVWQDYRQHRGPEREWFSYPNYVDYRAQNEVLEEMAVFEADSYTVTGRGEPEAVTGEAVSPSLFSLLGVRFSQGRGFLPEEAKPGAAAVAVISHDLWQRRYLGDPRLLGDTIMVNDEPRTVVGILAPEVYMPLVSEADVVVPLLPPEPSANARTNLTLRAVGRLEPSVSLTQARANLNAIAQRIERENPDAARDVGAAVYPLRDEMMGEARPALLALLATATMVLLIACVNVANLLLARTTARRGEIGLRTALGADPGRVVRQVLTESLLLASMGGTLALAVAVAGVEFLKRLAVAASFPLPRLATVQVDLEVLAFALLAALLTGLLFGLAPALEIRRTDITRVFQGVNNARSTAKRTGRLLVVFEMALALVLVVGASLMLRSFEKLQRVDTGFNPSEVLSFQVQTPETRYPEDHQMKAFYAALLERLDALPGVISAGAVSSVPFGGGATDARLRVEGRPEEEASVTLWYRIVSPDYLRTSGLAILRGRGIEDEDQTGTPRVAVINESAARQYFPDENPIGKGLWTSRDRYEIVGVAQNGRSFSLKTEEPPSAYFSYGQVPRPAMGIVVRTHGDPAELIGPVRKVLADLNPTMAATDLRPLDDLIAASVAPERALGLLMASFGLLALILAGVGLYGLMAYLTRQSTREISVRMALGAEAGRVNRLVLRQALALSTAGLVLGLVASLVLTRILDSMLFEVSAFDPLSFAAGSAILTAIALLASYLPARRASRLDPATVLRG